MKRMMKQWTREIVDGSPVSFRGFINVAEQRTNAYRVWLAQICSIVRL